MTHFPKDGYYKVIAGFYEGKHAERSNVPYINHIDEGIKILEAIDASKDAYIGYCLHPIFQADAALHELLSNDTLINELYYNGVGLRAIALTMEYRRVANSYLSHDKLEDMVPIVIPAVKEMLIADKVQNYKDFELYHVATHARAFELDKYFSNWFEVLGVDRAMYLKLSALIKN